MKKVRVGDKVTHKTYGDGVVQEEWGFWRACPSCYRMVTDKACPKCGDDPTLPHSIVTVNARGTFDVLFSDGKVRPINKHWLEARK